MDLSVSLNHILSTTDLTDPYEVAQKVLDSMTPEERDAALLTILPSWVRERMRPADTHALTTKKVNGGQPGPNKPWHQTWGLKRFPSAPGGFVMWHDFSLADALHAIDNANSQIERMHVHNAWRNKVIDALNAAGVDRVGDLPAEVREGLEATYPGNH